MPVAEGALLDRSGLAHRQTMRLCGLLAELQSRNRFYGEKWQNAGVDPASIGDIADLPNLPLTTKAELLADQERHPPYGSNLTYPLSEYPRLHQTSGTSGRPMRWLDTASSWNALLDCWETKYQVSGVTGADRVFFPFSFGPFLGFWTAFEAAARRGCLTLPGGGMTSAARLRFILDNEVNIVCCTPTYALRLAEVAQQQGLELGPITRGYRVRALIVAGEPGGSIPETRARIESAWHARVFDHSGLTEVGPMTVECVANPLGLHLLEEWYIPEVIDWETGKPVAAGATGELVITNLHRPGSPVIRYRTGDLVRVDSRPCPCGLPWVRFAGGILGRTDDMIHLRGNNVYPAALEAVLMGFREIEEYRVEIDQTGTLPALRIEVEPRPGEISSQLPERVSQAIREELLFRAEVVAVAPGSLPRSEMKTRRFIRKGGRGV